MNEIRTSASPPRRLLSGHLNIELFFKGSSQRNRQFFNSLVSSSWLLSCLRYCSSANSVTPPSSPSSPDSQELLTDIPLSASVLLKSTQRRQQRRVGRRQQLCGRRKGIRYDTRVRCSCLLSFCAMCLMANPAPRQDRRAALARAPSSALRDSAVGVDDTLGILIGRDILK